MFVLNALLSVPSAYPVERYAGGPDAARYLFDYNYIDRARSLEGLAALRRDCAAGRVDTQRTLLLAAKGLHPVADELFALARTFGDPRVFFELWNGLREVAQLAAAGLPHLYFLPVVNRLKQIDRRRLPERPNRRVFVSLGGDDDLDLVRRVVAGAPGLHFCVPDTCWAKPGSDKQFLDVRLPGDNVTAVDCSAIRHEPLGFSAAYRAAYASCDTVLIATRADRMHQMRGGVRLADALYARKYVVMTENPMCQLLMAQHERTCLVAEHDPTAVGEHLRRAAGGGFAVDEEAYEQIRRRTVDADKLEWMIDVGRDPRTAHGSPFEQREDPLVRARRVLFARGRALLEAEVQELAGTAARPSGER